MGKGYVICPMGNGSTAAPYDGKGRDLTIHRVGIAGEAASRDWFRHDGGEGPYLEGVRDHYSLPKGPAEGVFEEVDEIKPDPSGKRRVVVCKA
jgi:hypothetical protein